MEKNDQSYKLKPRNLGDEWEGWTGSIEDNLGDLETSQSLFLYLIGFSTLAFIGFIWLVYLLLLQDYLLNYNYLNLMANWIILSLSILSVIYLLLLYLTIWLKKPLSFFLKDKQFGDVFITKIAIEVGRKLKIPQDRIFNSMLKVNNTLTKIFYPKIKKEELLVLVPRCLSKQTRKDLNDSLSKYGLDFHIAAGGTQARQILKETKPKGIIAVACERDLYAGVKDVPSQVPVLAITNKRPEGPCKNTLVNTDEIENAIEFFLNKDLEDK